MKTLVPLNLEFQSSTNKLQVDKEGLVVYKDNLQVDKEGPVEVSISEHQKGAF